MEGYDDLDIERIIFSHNEKLLYLFTLSGLIIGYHLKKKKTIFTISLGGDITHKIYYLR